MAPLGLLTAVVSAIRVCGTPSMRAFIGRAQESPGTAEVELLSCTSETTAELFNEGGIARVFGEPRILEVMVKESETDPGKMVVGLFSDVNSPYWMEVTRSRLKAQIEKDLKSRFHRPNLSLNVGITQLPMVVTYAAAVVGIVLQVGMLVFAALTVYTFPDSFPVTDRGPAESYAFPMTFTGTVLVCFGMFLCAYIIERSTDEVHYKQCQSGQSKRCKMYWVQPGGQSIGDQVFGSFIGYSDNLNYIRSTKTDQGDGDVALLWIAATISVIGFIVQFVGLRAMHASVILFQIGVTMLMAIIRAMLRTQRLDGMKNLLGKSDGKRRTYAFSKNPKVLHGHELDLLALHLYKVDTLTVTVDTRGKLEDIPGLRDKMRTSTYGDMNYDLDYKGGGVRSSSDVSNSIETRQQLAKMTTSKNGPSWNDLEVRVAGSQLATAIEGVMEILAALTGPTALPGDVLKWSVTVNTTDISNLPYPTILSGLETDPTTYRTTPRNLGIPVSETTVLSLEKGEGLSWKANASQLESLIGLWALSIIIYDIRHLIEEQNPTNYRLISNKDLDTTNIWYHVWIQRRLSARTTRTPNAMLYSQSSFPIDKHLFGRLVPLQTDNYITEAAESFYVTTENSTIQMCAQDLFMFFLHAALQNIPDIGGETRTREHLSPNDIAMVLQNSTVEKLADRFESSGLGSREDAYMCIFPVLKQLGKMPKLNEVFDAAITQSEEYKTQGKWAQAEELLSWLYDNPSIADSHRASETLADFYYSAMFESEMRTTELGFCGICAMLADTNLTDPGVIAVLQEYGWIGLRIAEERNLVHERSRLLLCGAKDDMVKDYQKGLPPVEWARRDCLIMMKYLVCKKDSDLNGQDDNGRTPLIWALRNKNSEMAALLLQHGVDTAAKDKDGRTAASYAAENGLLEIIKILQTLPLPELMAHDERMMIPLMYAAENGHLETMRCILGDYSFGIDRRNVDGDTALHLAVRQDHMKVAELLMGSGADGSAANIHNQTALHVAASRGDESIVRLLLVHVRFDLEQRDALLNTPLDIASGAGHARIVELLLERNAQPFDYLWDRPEKRSAIRYAAKGGHLEVLKLLFASRERANTNSSDSAWNQNRSIALLEAIQSVHEDCVRYLMHPEAERILERTYDKTILQLATRTESLSMVKLVLEISTLAKNSDKERALHTAAGKGNLELIEFLLKNGAQINGKGRDGSTILHISTKRGDDDIVRLLLQHGAAVDAQTDRHETALHLAAHHRRTGVARLLIQHGADVHQVTYNTKTALWIAAESGAEDVASALLQAGADPNAATSVAETVLFVAAAKGREKIVKMLLENGAKESIGLRSLTRLNTPLFAAIENANDHSAVVKLLLDAGADVNVKDKDGKTALFEAARRGHDEIVKLLLDAKVEVNSTDKDGRSALFSTIERGKKTAAKLLLDARANVNLKDRAGVTPLLECSAIGAKYIEIIQLFLDYGADIDVRDSNGDSLLNIVQKRGFHEVRDIILEEVQKRRASA
ncbi:hypothetical protein H072_6288 [Dactylellina haptotyla CBS 200.50]|uniref:Uncharacterized protein n=1 Tax=Dactylellina haptotyla (strain CBS 200.50) TaxID=1284197 RepID=S8AFP7_DACHA|nr:hypothetical protein H072_6288 [Dactylellina haptotyla CBS 200.50]